MLARALTGQSEITEIASSAASDDDQDPPPAIMVLSPISDGIYSLPRSHSNRSSHRDKIATCQEDNAINTSGPQHTPEPDKNDKDTGSRSACEDSSMDLTDGPLDSEGPMQSVIACRSALGLLVSCILRRTR